MATRQTERHVPVHFYDLYIGSHAAKGYKISSPGCKPIGEVLHAALHNAVKSDLNPSARAIFKSLEDTRPYPGPRGTFALLLNIADGLAPDPTFKNIKKKTLRPAGKMAVEAISKSCHALIIPDANSADKALLIMTMRSGINSKDVVDLLNKLAAIASQDSLNDKVYEFAHPSSAKGPDGRPLTYRVNYHFRQSAHASEQLDTALRTGIFKEMTLFEEDQQAFDQGGSLQITQKALTVKATKKQRIGWEKLKQSIRGYLKESPDSSFNKLKVSYAAENGDPKSTTVDFNRMDEAFTRREHITLSVNTPDCFTSVDTDIIQELSKLA